MSEISEIQDSQYLSEDEKTDAYQELIADQRARIDRLSEENAALREALHGLKQKVAVISLAREKAIKDSLEAADSINEYAKTLLRIGK